MSGKSRIIVEYDGQVHTLKEWAKITGFKYVTLCNRYAKGYRGEKLFAKDITINCKICGKEFTTKCHITKCCSDECTKENARRNAKLCDERKKLQPKKEKKLTLTEIAVMAKEAGMTYGQYSAMLALRKEREANGKV